MSYLSMSLGAFDQTPQGHAQSSNQPPNAHSNTGLNQTMSTYGPGHTPWNEMTPLANMGVGTPQYQANGSGMDGNVSNDAVAMGHSMSMGGMGGTMMNSGTPGAAGAGAGEWSIPPAPASTTTPMQGAFGASGLESVALGSGMIGVAEGVGQENSDEYWNALIDGESKILWMRLFA
jgi:hypothetical protein